MVKGVTGHPVGWPLPWESTPPGAARRALRRRRSRAGGLPKGQSEGQFDHAAPLSKRSTHEAIVVGARA
eukprot:scaffold119931_cov57-Phaeocystis_antarctica.AAC.1